MTTNVQISSDINPVRSAIAKKAKGRTVSSCGNGGEYLGDLVAWDIADNDGFSAPRSAVRHVFARNGFEDVIADSMRPDKAIKKAMKIVSCGSQLVVRQMAKHKRDTSIAVAVYRKYSVEGERGDYWIAGARVRIDSATDRVVSLPMPDQTDADPLCKHVADELAAKANELVERVTNRELSLALTDVGRNRVRWATYRRKMGGVWFVLAQFSGSFRSLLRDLEKLGGFYPIIQPLFIDAAGNTEKNVEYAAVGVLEAEMTRLSKDLATALEDDSSMRSSTIEKRIAELDDVMARVELYSSILSSKAETFRAQAAQVQANFRKVLDGGEGLVTTVQNTDTVDIHDLSRFDF